MKLRRSTLTATALVAVLSGGCGSTGEDDTGLEGNADDLPPCSEVWLDGETLPDGYAGCFTNDDNLIRPDTYDCADGRTLTTFQELLYAFQGEEITRVEESFTLDDGFDAALEECAPR